MCVKQWVVGLTLSIVVGGIVTWVFLTFLRAVMGLGGKPKPQGKNIARVPPWLTGIVERTFFTTLVAFNIEGIAAAMVGWIALKFATNWNRDDWKKNPVARPFAFSALLAGLLSMLFAVLGGLVCKGEILSQWISRN